MRWELILYANKCGYLQIHWMIYKCRRRFINAPLSVWYKCLEPICWIRPSNPYVRASIVMMSELLWWRVVWASNSPSAWQEYPWLYTWVCTSLYSPGSLVFMWRMERVEYGIVSGKLVHPFLCKVSSNLSKWCGRGEVICVTTTCAINNVGQLNIPFATWTCDIHVHAVTARHASSTHRTNQVKDKKFEPTREFPALRARAFGEDFAVLRSQACLETN